MQSDYDSKIITKFQIGRRDVRACSRNIFCSGCSFPSISSEVHKANHKTTGIAVALKYILMPHKKRLLMTALREVKILKAPNILGIVEVLDMFVV